MDIFKQMKENRDKLEAKDLEAKAKGTLVGRYIEEPFADGSAVYVIVREGKLSVVIESVKGLGDDWVIPYWGHKATIKREYAVCKINFRDNLRDLCSK